MNKYGANGIETLKVWRAFVIMSFIATNTHITASSGNISETVMWFATGCGIGALVFLLMFFASNNRKEDE